MLSTTVYSPMLFGEPYAALRSAAPSFSKTIVAAAVFEMGM
jgi:hypothetical protein